MSSSTAFDVGGCSGYEASSVEAIATVRQVHSEHRQTLGRPAAVPALASLRPAARYADFACGSNPQVIYRS